MHALLMPYFSKRLFERGVISTQHPRKVEQKVEKLSEKRAKIQFICESDLASKKIQKTSKKFEKIQRTTSSILGLCQEELPVQFSGERAESGAQGDIRFGDSEGKEVAVKTCRDDSKREALEREAKLLQRAQGTPHLVQFKGFGLIEKSPALMMEKAGNCDLASVVISGKNLSLDAALMLAKQTLETLQELQEKEILHRDIKPENIVYDFKTNQFVIVDLGSGTHKVKENQRCGTLMYASPEFLFKMPSHPRQDVWSLGLTLFTAFTGRTLLDDNKLARCMKKMQRQFGPIPQSMIQIMDENLRDNFFKIKEGQYVFRSGRIQQTNEWEEEVRRVGKRNRNSEQEIQSFIDLLRRMFSYDHPSAKELLNHPSMQTEVSFRVHHRGEKNLFLEIESDNSSKKHSFSRKRSFELSKGKQSLCTHVKKSDTNQYKIRVIQKHKLRNWTFRRVRATRKIQLSQGGQLQIHI